MATVALESLSCAFQETAAQCGEEIALRVEGGEQLSWRDYAARVERIARGLAALGVGRGDSVVSDDGQPARVQPLRHSRVSPRRGAVLDLQHLRA